MSDYMHLPCATCAEDAEIESSKSGRVLRELALAAPVLKQLEATGVMTVSGLVVYGDVNGHTFGVEWLVAHAGHDLVLVSEYGPVVWSSRQAPAAHADREICICAALRLPDGRIIRGHRHGDCIRTAEALVRWQNDPESGVNGPAWHPSMSCDQGFVTSRGRYVGREEGLALQQAAGIPSACRSGYRARELFSEDLY